MKEFFISNTIGGKKIQTTDLVVTTYYHTHTTIELGSIWQKKTDRIFNLFLIYCKMCVYVYL